MPLINLQDQETAKRIILSAFNKKRLASTYLFYGDDGVGKWQMALILAALLNCEKPMAGADNDVIDVCGHCRDCQQIFNLTFPELVFCLPIPPHKNANEAIELHKEFLEAKREEPYRIVTWPRQPTIPIDTVRAVKQKAALKTPTDVKRVILFYQMERMLPSSADSLLKLIEEPSDDTTIILTVRNPKNLLPTVQSRTQKIGFKAINARYISKYLEDKYKIVSAKTDLYSRLAKGSIGRALNLALDEKQSPIRQLSFLMFKSLFQKDNPSAIAVVNEFINPRDFGEFEKILSNWQSFLSDLIIIKFNKEMDNIVNTDLLNELERMSNRVTEPNGFIRMTNAIKDVKISLRRNVHIRPAVSALVLKIREYINQSA
jgi:DNA polymerase-3 subunit delta'